jgi:YD repeat-containing protein
MSVAVAPDGTLYAVLKGCDLAINLCDDIGTVIVRFVDGIMYRVAGSGCVGDCGSPWADGDRALDVRIRPTGIAFDRSGTLYFSDFGGTVSETYHRVATVTPDGLVYAAAGIRGGPFSAGSALPVADGSPATNSLFELTGSRPIATGPGGLYVLNARFNGLTETIFRATTPLPDHLGVASFTPAQGADAVYGFDPLGRHVSTIHSLTGAPLVALGYDAAGRISTITDEAGNVTTVVRTSHGAPLAIVAPFGQRTELELDADGYLSRVTDPAGNSTTMEYSNGLLTSFTNARWTAIWDWHWRWMCSGACGMTCAFW